MRIWGITSETYEGDVNINSAGFKWPIFRPGQSTQLLLFNLEMDAATAIQMQMMGLCKPSKGKGDDGHNRKPYRLNLEGYARCRFPEC